MLIKDTSAGQIVVSLKSGPSGLSKFKNIKQKFKCLLVLLFTLVIASYLVITDMYDR